MLNLLHPPCSPSWDGKSGRGFAAVICAAGASSRMGGIKKEYRLLKDSITVLGKAVSAFTSNPLIKTIVITVLANGESAAREALAEGNLGILSAQAPKILFTEGGETRRASVFNALSLLAAYNPRYVLIHDGARPWVSPSLIERIIEAVEKYSAVIPVLPITDTPKEFDGPLEPQQDGKAAERSSAFIKNHLKRVNTGVAQTPQAFAFPEILRAHEKAALVKDEEFTDDAEIWGRFCGPVAVVHGEQENRKITFPEDLV